MKSRPLAERTKPFRLIKYFSLSSLIVIFMGTVVLSILNAHWVRSMQYQKSEAFALLLVESLNHQVFMQFILPVGLKYGKIELSNKDQFARMDSVVRSTLHSFRVKMVNIYGMKDIITYSFDTHLVGLENLGGSSYKNAIAGKTTSKLIQKGSFWELFFGVPKEIKIITFAPLRAEKPLSPISGPVLGVVEIVQDLSNDYQNIFRFQMLTMLTICGVMTGLFLIMFVVVKRGEGIIQTRAEERLRLEEQLGRAKHLSSLGEMVAGVSHEIRNPLGIISSSAELLKKKIGAEQSLMSIPDIIIEESGRLNNIITDFLNYAKPKVPNRFPCRLQDVIEKNINYLSPQIDAGGYRVETRMESGLPEIMADADMLYQAFLNVLINAMQAMPGGGRILVRAKLVEQTVWVVFEDEGHGVSAETMEKMWDPFFTTKDKGTGLGLGIVKNIVEAHDGQIRLDNRAGGGARITIQLPVKQESA